MAGFDDYEISKFVDPSITTMTHPKRHMGETAAKLLLDMLDKNKGDNKMLDSELIVRDSTKGI